MVPKDPETLYQDYLEFETFIKQKYGGVMVAYVDSAEQVLKRGIQKHTNIPVKDSIKNEINDRIRIVNQLIASGRFFVTEDCETLIDALSMAVWDPKEITISKRLDDGTSDIDTLDAFEYSFEKYMKQLNIV